MLKVVKGAATAVNESDALSQLIEKSAAFAENNFDRFTMSEQALLLKEGTLPPGLYAALNLFNSIWKLDSKSLEIQVEQKRLATAFIAKVREDSSARTKDSGEVIKRIEKNLLLAIESLNKGIADIDRDLATDKLSVSQKIQLRQQQTDLRRQHVKACLQVGHLIYMSRQPRFSRSLRWYDQHHVLAMKCTAHVLGHPPISWLGLWHNMTVSSHQLIRRLSVLLPHL